VKFSAAKFIEEGENALNAVAFADNKSEVDAFDFKANVPIDICPLTVEE
jgi:hypothetical protein